MDDQAMSDKKTPAKHRDPRIERVLRAAEQHGLGAGEPEHHVGDLEDVLRAAWGLMTAAQRNSLMAGADALEVLKSGDDYVEVAQLRGYLLDGHGVHRVVIEMTREGGDAQPYLTSLKYFDAHMAEIDRHARGINPEALRHLAGRLDDEMVEAMPPQEPPAWTGTIDWDLKRDILTQSIKLRDHEVQVRPVRWLDASQALDAQRVGESIDSPVAARVMVMELLQPADVAETQWVELHLSQSVLDNVGQVRSASLGGASSPVILGTGTSRAAHEIDEAAFTPLDANSNWEVVFEGGRASSDRILESARIPVSLFLQWHAERPTSEVLFVSKAGELLNEQEDFARTHQWVEDYQRWCAPALDEVQTEFEVERPNA